VATYGSVQMGEKIFVIGHPEGLNFSSAMHRFAHGP